MTRRSAPWLVAAALLLWPVAARAGGDPTFSPTPPPGLTQGKRPTPPAKHKPSHRHHATRPAKRHRATLPKTGADLPHEAAVAAMLIAGGALLRAPRYFGRR
jgi:hypothetical protein